MLGVERSEPARFAVESEAGQAHMGGSMPASEDDRNRVQESSNPITNHDDARGYVAPRAWFHLKQALERMGHGLPELAVQLERAAGNGSVRLMLAAAIHQFLSGNNEARAAALVALCRAHDVREKTGKWPERAPEPDPDNVFKRLVIAGRLWTVRESRDPLIDADGNRGKIMRDHRTRTLWVDPELPVDELNPLIDAAARIIEEADAPAPPVPSNEADDDDEGEEWKRGESAADGDIISGWRVRTLDGPRGPRRRMIIYLEDRVIDVDPSIHIGEIRDAIERAERRRHLPCSVRPPERLPEEERVPDAEFLDAVWKVMAPVGMPLPPNLPADARLGRALNARGVPHIYSGGLCHSPGWREHCPCCGKSYALPCNLAKHLIQKHGWSRPSPHDPVCPPQPA